MKNFLGSYRNKISLVAYISVFIAGVLLITTSYLQFNSLYSSASDEINKGLDKVNSDFLKNHIGMTSTFLENKIINFFDEQAMIADMYQKVIDNPDSFDKIIETARQTPFFKDKISFNGRWYQNTSDEPATLLIERNLLDLKFNIKPEVYPEIDRSAILELIMPSVYKYGSKKLWIYFTGPKNMEFMRVTPWNDIGSALDKVYPAFTDVSIWDSFNPGLVEAWESLIKNDSSIKNNLRDMAIMKSPSQDGGTGKIIMSMNFPVWNSSRNHFLGSVSFDVELTEIINYTSKIKISETGFAFISQSNGNIFALNPKGESILGLKSAAESTIKKQSGAEYNPMLRFFKESSFEEVRKIKLIDNNETKIEELNIKNIKYILVQKKLAPLNSWSKEKGFYKEIWTLGFIVPKNEIYSTYYTVQKQMNEVKNSIIINQFIIFLITILVSGIFIYIISKNMTNDLKKLEKATQNIVKNNYDFNVDIKSRDEIATLGNTFKTMSLEIRNSFIRLTETNEQLSGLSTKYEEIINMISKLILDTELNEEYFLKSLLDSAIKIVPEADYGSISKVYDDKWEFIAAIGHNIDGLKSLNLYKKYMYPIVETVIVEKIESGNELNMPEDIFKKFTLYTKPTKESIFAPLKIKNELIGNIALDISVYSDKNFSEESKKAITALASIASSFTSFQKYVEIRDDFQKDIILSMIKILEIYDKYTEGHSKEVAERCADVLKNFTDDEVELQKIYWAGLVHDIGKILVPETILNKPDKLTSEEFSYIKKHPGYGYEILRNSKQLKDIAIIIKHHHERYDGTGYPDKLSGESIPLYSRIIAVVDSYDAMVSNRAYRKALDKEEAIAEIIKNKGTQFDPKIADAFLELLKNQ